MVKFLASVAIAVLIVLPAKATVTSAADALLSMRLEVDPPDTGPVIIECGPSPTQAGLEARVKPAAFATQTASRLLCPRLERENAIALLGPRGTSINSSVGNKHPLLKV
jgi:hypothetical protein